MSSCACAISIQSGPYGAPQGDLVQKNKFSLYRSQKLLLKWLFNATINDISLIYVTAHRFAGGMKKLDLRSGSQRHRHFVGFFNVPVWKHRHGTNLFIRWFRHTAPIRRLLRHILDLTPGPSRGYGSQKPNYSLILLNTLFSCACASLVQSKCTGAPEGEIV